MRRYIEQGLEGSRCRSFCSCGVGACHPPSTLNVFTNPEALRTPCFRIFMKALSQKHDSLFTQFPASLSFLEDRGEGGAEDSKFLVMVWFFWWPAPILKLSRNPPRVTSLEQKTPLTQEIPKDLGALCHELESKTKYESKMHPGALVNYESTRVLGSLGQEQRAETNTCIDILSISSQVIKETETLMWGG